MQARRLIPLLLALFVLTAARADTPSTNPANYGLTTPSALNALADFRTAEGEARQVYWKSRAQAQQKLVGQWEKLKDQFTRAGDLDNAVKLRDAITAVKAETGDPTAKEAEVTSKAEATNINPNRLQQLLANTRWKKAGSRAWIMTLHPDASATADYHSHKGCWTVIGPDTIRLSVSMNSCESQVLKIQPDGRSLLDLSSNQVDFTLVSEGQR